MADFSSSVILLTPPELEPRITAPLRPRDHRAERDDW